MGGDGFLLFLLRLSSPVGVTEDKNKAKEKKKRVTPTPGERGVQKGGGEWEGGGGGRALFNKQEEIKSVDTRPRGKQRSMQEALEELYWTEEKLVGQREKKKTRDKQVEPAADTEIKKGKATIKEKQTADQCRYSKKNLTWQRGKAVGK